MSKLEHPTVSHGLDLLVWNTELSLGEYSSITRSQEGYQLDMVVGRARSAGIKAADTLRMMIDNR